MHRRPSTPGEVLLEEFLKPLGMSQNALAKAIHVTPMRVNDIVRGKRGVSADTAWRLSIAFGTTPEFWMHLQMKVDLYDARPCRQE